MEPTNWDSIKLTVQEVIFRILQILKALPTWQRLVLIVCALGLIPGYFVAKIGTRVIVEQQNKKYLVSARPSFSNPQAIGVEPVTMLTILPGEYAAYAKITNPNFELAAPSVRYEMKFFNASNEQRESTKGTLFLLPGETKYLVAPRIVAPERLVKGTVTLGEVQWQKRADIPVVKLKASDPIRGNQTDPQAFFVEGDVLNDSPYRLKKVSITLLLYGKNNKIIAVSSRDEFDIPSRTRRAYRLTWPGVFSNDVQKIEVQTETNTVDDSNLLLEKIEQNPDSLDRPTSDR